MTSYEHKVKNIYLWEPWWSPWSDTVFYIKWEWDIIDYWPNNYQFTNNSVTINDNYLYFPWTDKNGLIKSDLNLSVWSTFNVWIWVETARLRTENPRILAHDSSEQWDILRYSWSTYKIGANYTLTLQTWVNLCFIYNGATNCKLYANWILVDSNLASVSPQSWIRIWSKHESTYDPHKWRMARIILENKIRTDQEVADYFDQTKTDYGIS
jgi:hypothetical protein